MQVGQLALGSSIVLGLLATLASSQTPTEQRLQPVSYVAEWQVKRGMEQAYVDLIDEIYTPVFSRLMSGEEPVIMGWGVRETFLHHPDGPTHTMWYTVPDMAAIDKINAALDAANEVESVEASASGLPQPTKLGQRIEAIANTATHRDVLYRHLVYERSETPAAPNALPNLWVFRVKALAGKEAEYKKLWEKYYQPIFSGWVADGTARAYGLAVQAARVTHEFTHVTWLSFADYASYQKAYEEFTAHQATLDEEQSKRQTAEFLAVTDPEATRTSVWESRIHHVASSD